ncbi:hypothetical protein GCM10010319_57060 [Streptomyces blastmyceticus]|uniref:Integrase n=1 Tax=Streptomyces blastmyceticus TaxID=68180 RepID=A0ABN0XS83_9ACTN
MVFEGLHLPPLFLPRPQDRQETRHLLPQAQQQEPLAPTRYARSCPPRKNGGRRSFARGGFDSRKAAQADLDHVRALLGLAESDDPEGTELIAAMLTAVSSEKTPLPDVEETRRRLNAGQDIGSLAVSEWLDRWLAGKRKRKSGLNRYETDIRVHLKPRIGGRRLDRLRVSHLSEMFTDIREANAQILEQNDQRRAAIDELATVPWKGVDKRARRKAMKAAIDETPPFRRITGPATRQHVKATLRAALNDAIGQQIITFNPAAHVEIDPVRKPKALVWTDERVAKWEQTGEKPSPVMVWTPQQTGAVLDFVAEGRLYAMWHVIAFRSLRRGEACGQPWSETNLDTHFSDTRITRDIYQSALPQVGKNAAEATAKLVPLQRKAEAEKAARKAAKKAKAEKARKGDASKPKNKAKAQAQAKKKAKRQKPEK